MYFSVNTKHWPEGGLAFKTHENLERFVAVK